MLSQYAVFGNPIAQSLSPLIHQAFAKQCNQPIEYQRQLVELGKFEAAASQFFNAGGEGLNITAPFKLDAFQFADQLSERAKCAGAVNTLIAEHSKIKGDNTDGHGLLTDIQNNLQWNIAAGRVLILGAGGAVRGILEPLIAAIPASIVIANRTTEKAQTLVQLFEEYAQSESVELSAQDFESLSGHFDIIINGTSASLSGESLPIGVDNFDNVLCYDMMYAKAPTPFLQLAAKHGAKSVADGLGMLVEQAAESFYLWRGVRPDTAALIQSIRAGL